MAYTPKVWQDGSSGGTPLTAAELNRIEAGVDAGIEGVGVTAIVKMSQAEYNALGSYDPNTLYVIGS